MRKVLALIICLACVGCASYEQKEKEKTQKAFEDCKHTGVIRLNFHKYVNYAPKWVRIDKIEDDDDWGSQAVYVYFHAAGEDK